MREETGPDEQARLAVRTPSTGPGHEAAAADHPTAEGVTDPRFELLYNAIYHDLAAARCGRRHQWATLLVLILGSSGMAAAAATFPPVAFVSGIAISVIAAATFVFDWAGEARRHLELKRRYHELRADLVDGRDGHVAERMEILLGDEPPADMGLAKIAHDRAGRSMYGEDFNRA